MTDHIGLLAGPSYSKETAGWTAPKRIVVANLAPGKLAELKRVAPDIEFVPARTKEEAAKFAATADAVVGYCTPEICTSNKNLRWVQVGSAGIDQYLFPEMTKSAITLTNTQRIYAPEIADHVFAMVLAHTRKLTQTLPAQTQGTWLKFEQNEYAQELRGRTMLIVGLGGIGTEVARRAHGFGLRVLAIDPKALARPDFVFSLERPERLKDRLGEADLVVIACPLTAETKGLIGVDQFKAMKPTAIFVNVARGGVIDQEALVSALKNKTIAAAGLDVTEPEPLPTEHPLWKLPNVILTPHIASQSQHREERLWLLYRENIRRFAVGEPLLCVVDKAKGY